MKKYYCKRCTHFVESAFCLVHGADHTILVDPELFKQKPDPHPGTHGSVPKPDLTLAFVKQPHVDPDWPVPRVDGAVKNATMPFRVQRTTGKTSALSSSEILRFRESERLLHWAIAIPFMLCWVTSLILVVIYNPDPLRPYREVFTAIHRISGICLIVLPILVLFRGRRDRKVHLYNIKTAWFWSMNDLKWLALMGLAAINKKIRLPEQGKFNAAEKVNFIFVLIACPVLVITGMMIWLQNMAWLAWLIHASVALLVSPTILGHIYMAVVNPKTRVGLKGMISGYVQRQWAKHHYGIWYRENFENNSHGIEKPPHTTLAPDRADHHVDTPSPELPGDPVRVGGSSPRVVTHHAQRTAR